ncbi:uncharacterized protein LOC108670095, partial [Hyalella azteca]|uniref:Uncharacterized protein LOC108670095 n=1 Tax=Hyalella azteca TaxID=294128 RepID=A0A979FVR2_HYAAZ
PTPRFEDGGGAGYGGLCAAVRAYGRVATSRTMPSACVLRAPTKPVTHVRTWCTLHTYDAHGHPQVTGIRGGHGGYVGTFTVTARVFGRAVGNSVTVNVGGQHNPHAVYGTRGTGPDMFMQPAALCVLQQRRPHGDVATTVFVADTGNSRIKVLDGGCSTPEWEAVMSLVVSKAGSSTPELEAVMSLVVPKAGGSTPEWEAVMSLVVSKAESSTPEWEAIMSLVVSKADSSTPACKAVISLVVSIAGCSTPEWEAVMSLVVSKAGSSTLKWEAVMSLVVSKAGSSTPEWEAVMSLVVPKAGSRWVMLFTHDKLKEPTGIAVTALGEILVVDGCQVHVFSPSGGKLIASWGERGNTDGKLGDVGAICTVPPPPEEGMGDSVTGYSVLEPRKVTEGDQSVEDASADADEPSDGEYCFETGQGGPVFDYALGTLIFTIDSSESRLKRPAGLATTDDGWALVPDIAGCCVRRYRYR